MSDIEKEEFSMNENKLPPSKRFVRTLTSDQLNEFANWLRKWSRQITTTGWGFKDAARIHNSQRPYTPEPVPVRSSLPPCSNWSWYNQCLSQGSGVSYCRQTIEADVGSCSP
jgi:hypothetical protein